MNWWMEKKLVLILVAATASLSLVSQAHAAGTMVDLPGTRSPARAYLATPEGDGPFPAVIVIQEWWGLTDWIKENADRLAKQGYVALAVDLYGGKSTIDPGEAHELMRALDPSDGVAILQAGVKFLEAHPAVDHSKRLGAIGWCMGGMYSRLIAQTSDKVGPIVICYGSVTDDPEQTAKLKDNAVLGIFGATDRGIPVDKVKQFAEAVGPKVDLHVYEGAGHGFMRPGGNQHNAKAAADAWTKIEEFFTAQLK